MKPTSTEQPPVPGQSTSTVRRPFLRALASASALGALGASPFVRPVAAAPLTPSEVRFRVRVARQRVDGGTFSAAVVGRDGGAGRGVILLSTERGRERYLVEEARVVCEAGEPTAVELRGTAVVTDLGVGTTRDDFHARVEEAELEECLIFDIGGSGVNPPKKIEVEGELQFALTACDRTDR